MADETQLIAAHKEFKERHSSNISYEDFCKLVNAVTASIVKTHTFKQKPALISTCDQSVYIKQVSESATLLLARLETGKLMNGVHLSAQTYDKIYLALSEFFNENVPMEKG